MKSLIIVPAYPNKNRVDYQFVHERIKKYINEYGLDIDVFCWNNIYEHDYLHEEVNVIVGNKQKLKQLIDSYDKIVFHFLNIKNGKFILKHIKDKPNYVWFHGSDSVHWRRRLAAIDLVKSRDIFNVVKLIKLFALININAIKKHIIKKINKNCKNTKFVFVSNWLKKASEQDFGITYNNFEVIPNYINLDEFGYEQKTPEQRYKVLVVNNFANSIYGGDMIRDIIVGISKTSIFDKFVFNIYGDGKQWKSSTEILQQFANVKLHKGFLSRADIKKQHKQNGVFLYPKRGDSQGVSRCEAMSSGLVSIASDVEAISEFSPENTTYLAKNIEDFISYFKFIDENPDDFLAKSIESAEYIRIKCSYKNTIEKEIQLIKGEIK